MNELKDIAIFGAGGFGREVACLLARINKEKPQWRLVGFYDDGFQQGTHLDYGEVLGGMAELNAVTRPLSVVVALGNPSILKSVVEQITNENIEFPNIISPDVALLDPASLKMGKGNVVCMGNYFSCQVSMGDFNMFVGYITVGHDSTFGDFNCLMPGARISGRVTIGDSNLIGSGAVALQGLSIGNSVTIGAASVLIANPNDGHTYIGNPAKKMF